MSRLTPDQINGNQVVQLGFIVEDLRAAAHQWAAMFGAGPFFVHDEIPATNVKDCNGDPAVYPHGVAIGQWGSVMVELIRVGACEPESVAGPMGRVGFNHLAYFSSDPQAEVERLTKAGAPLIVSMELDGKPIYFHDGRDTHGFIIEHCAYSEVIESIYGAVADAAANWDGTDPVRGPLF